VAEYAAKMRELNQKFLCITDHGVMGAVPQQIAECEKHNLHPVFGCELYVNYRQPEVETRKESAEIRKSLGDGGKEASIEQKKFDKSSHMTAIAYTEQGYQNLVRITSWGWIHGYYRKPRVNHDVLQRYKEGIVFLSGCANSEIANALKQDGEDAAMQMLEKYISMFSPHFYLEIMMINYDWQMPYNEFLIKAHDKYGVPLVLTQDCHYCAQEHSHNQRLMLIQQSKRTIQAVNAMIESGDGEDLFELQDTNLWLKSEDELNAKWESSYQDNIDYELYKEAKANSVKIAQMAEGVELNREIKLPKVPNAEALLWQETLKGFKARGCPATTEYRNRIQEEYDLVCEKGFASYFLIQKQMTDEARRVGPEILGFGDGSEAVGPGRGSACGSLVAYCLRLHDVEPIIHDLRFSRFLSPARGGRQLRIRHSLRPVPHEEVDWKREGL
jgi:DNA polymerase-3 subunit alpha